MAGSASSDARSAKSSFNTNSESASKNNQQPPDLAPIDDQKPQPAQVKSQMTPKNVSNADVKKIKKAEKAARRAQAKDGPPSSGPAPAATPLEPRNENQRQSRAVGPSANSSSQAQQQRKSDVTRPSATKHSKEAVERAPHKTKTDDKNVALFGHLYGHVRRSSLAHASKDVHPAVLALGLKISSYSICGSTARCVAMLLAFKRLIESYTTPPGHALSRHLVSYLSPQIDFLVSCRPLAMAMGNAIRWLKTEISASDIDAEEGRLKVHLCGLIDNFIKERITAAGQVISNTAQEKIQDGDVVLTYANSQVISQTLVQASRNGRRFKVIVLDSRPLHEGRNMAKALAGAGIDVTYSTLHAASHLVGRATKVLLGAHSMLGNGRLYSRAGSAMVAMLAKAANIPVIVCCHSIKFADRVALDSIVTNEVAPPEELLLEGQDMTALCRWREAPKLQLLNLVYDVTPAEYISLVVTEHGTLPPSSVPVLHRLSTNT